MKDRLLKVAQTVATALILTVFWWLWGLDSRLAALERDTDALRALQCKATANWFLNQADHEDIRDTPWIDQLDRVQRAVGEACAD